MISKGFIVKFIIFLFFIQCYAILEYTEPVETNKGFVQGEVRKTVQRKLKYSSFKGIPYAEPPLRTNRFRYAAEAKPWEGVLNTTRNPSPCPQWHPKKNYYFGNEDCLYLNVYTPELNFTNPELRTVMVWIHGGNFVAGSINNYGPDFFIEKGVIIVAMNYRLGAFGFLSLNDTLASGNAGLKDQLQALRWVQKNIKRFGGDPEKVTIFGENAGAVSVELHKLCDESVGLFRGSIAMDGTPLTAWGFHTQSKALERTYNLLRKFGIRKYNKQQIYSILLRLSAGKIAKATQEMMIEMMDVPFKPTVEAKSLAKNPFLTKCPVDKYKTGNFSQTPHFLGVTKERLGRFNRPLEGLSSTGRASGRYTIKGKRSGQATNVGVGRTQRYLSAFSPAPVFYYFDSFDYKSALRKEKIETSSGNDVWADEDDYDVDDENGPRQRSPESIKHRNQKVTMWTNYAKYLRPTLDDDDKELGVIWEEYEEGRNLDMSLVESKSKNPRLAQQLRYIENTCN